MWGCNAVLNTARPVGWLCHHCTPCFLHKVEEKRVTLTLFLVVGSVLQVPLRLCSLIINLKSNPAASEHYHYAVTALMEFIRTMFKSCPSASSTMGIVGASQGGGTDLHIQIRQQLEQAGEHIVCASAALAVCAGLAVPPPLLSEQAVWYRRDAWFTGPMP